MAASPSESGTSSGAPASGAGDAASHGAFALLHSGVQRQLWRIGWGRLRPLQVKAIHAIMETDRHMILAAATASGKTEAAFLPVLSQIADDPTGSVRAVYIGPLKALINDQFQRVEDLCSYVEVPVHRWHGDVSASRKSALIRTPGGVLLITPESLESLFVNRSAHLTGLFAGLRFIVIDEIHTFLENERGLHLRSLLSRVGLVVSSSRPEAGACRTVGLSATIGDTSVAQAFVAPEHPQDVTVIDDTEEGKKEIKYRVHGYRFRESGPGPAVEASAGATGEEDPERTYRRGMANDMVAHCRGRANLVFANAKADVEEFADLCKQVARSQKLNVDFLVHHGSLAAEIREDAEETMKSGRPATTFCSSTLELGIDIGSVYMVGQIGPPWSVSSLTQRLGRSGRHEGEPRIMRMYLECWEPQPDDDVLDRLHLNLVQSVALTELMLQGWLEPPWPPRYDLSTLTQQIISVIAETGGIEAGRLFDRLCRKGPFREIERLVFEVLLRSLGSKDVIEQMPTGDLILGLRGERIRQSRGFYAVFPTPEAFALIHKGTVLGTLEVVPKEGDHLLFAGKRWRVTEIDMEARQVQVVPAKGWKRPQFTGAFGETHPRVRQEMRHILQEKGSYDYLDEGAASLLEDARRAAGKGYVCEQSLVPLGPQATAFMTWTGDRIQQTVRAILAHRGVACGDRGVALELRLPLDETRDSLRKAASASYQSLDLARHIFPRIRRKYDWLLHEELVDASIAEGWLDLDGAMLLLSSVK